MSKQLEIKLVKSLIGRLPNHITIAKQLGLTKLNRVVVHNDNNAIRGMIKKVDYLVEVQEKK
ncbi:MAG: 50S ribosomal protein L30 [Legionellales bacterium RIFCSPHIGHO2_12_FULL_37_14]|nr:MAG: 50S ribosomal protein L30 [Legionellales bacterium RIFCSPHIGHO2_12_FULL_37_14]